MNALHPYSAYKQSGIEWIGQIPAHWQACRTKFVARLYSGHTPSRDKPEYWVPEECTIPWFTLADVWQLRDGTRTYLGDTSEKISPLGLANSAACLLPVGTVIVSRTASVGFAGIMSRPMATTQDFVNWVCGKRIRPRFLLHVFRAMRGEFSRLMMGSTHQTIYMPDVRSFTTALPPLDEQEEIIAFLDRETARIDGLIAKKRRLIELLREKRQAVISHAVTKGLDPNAPKKDSGVEWLGDIPAHWEVKRLKHVATRIQTGTTPPTSEGRYYENGDLSWYGPASFGPDLPLGDPVKLINREAVVERTARLFDAGSVLIVTIGATIGRVAFLEAEGSTNQQITAVTIDRRRAIPRFIAFQCKRLEPTLRSIAPSSTLPIFDQGEIGALPVAIPPLEEQVRVSAHLKESSHHVAVAIEQIEAAIAKLEEHRAALIAAAVTGKIDVRGYAADAVEAAD